MRRVLVGELIDEPGISDADLQASLEYIRVVNRRFGGSRALIRHLSDWSRRWPRDRPVTMLDVGTGSADIPMAARAWARSRGFDLRITAMDLHEKTVALARAHVAADPGIEIVRGDALTLDRAFSAGQFDYTHAGMFLHHLTDQQVATVLRGMDHVARAGMVWNDLHRSRFHHAFIGMMVLGQRRVVSHDARASVAAGFTREDCEGFARRLGLDYLRYRRPSLWYRFTMAGEKSAAWTGRDPPSP